MAHDPTLAALADRVGILPGFIDQKGAPQTTSDDSRKHLLEALGYDVRTPTAATETLARLEAEPAPVLPPVRVTHTPRSQRLALPAGASRTPWRAEVTREDGEVLRAEGRGATLPLPEGLPHGYHTVRLWLGEAELHQELILTPPRAVGLADLLGAPDPRLTGVWSNLYTVRSEADWGFGDLSTLGKLAEWLAPMGADFLGVNPLHALKNTGVDISPYSPVSRLYRNVLYLDVEAFPEWRSSAAERALAEAPGHAQALARLRGAAHLDYPALLGLKWPFFVALHATFEAEHGRGNTPRGRDFAAYVEAQGVPLRDFATFCGLAAHLAREGHGESWQAWPEGYRSPTSPKVRAFAEANAALVRLHMFLQFELDRQLGAAAARAKAAGMALGLYQDLAIGTGPGGAEPWAYPDL
ncbi:MAG TPA: 4-alpha-glucanotransferase, partial [Myxococcota bacterium]|nr:4-alpha-glucanotransferase [Myxococcota bacterium]